MGKASTYAAHGRRFGHGSSRLGRLRLQHPERRCRSDQRDACAENRGKKMHAKVEDEEARCRHAIRDAASPWCRHPTAPQPAVQSRSLEDRKSGQDEWHPSLQAMVLRRFLEDRRIDRQHPPDGQSRLGSDRSAAPVARRTITKPRERDPARRLIERARPTRRCDYTSDRPAIRTDCQFRDRASLLPAANRVRRVGLGAERGRRISAQFGIGKPSIRRRRQGRLRCSRGHRRPELCVEGSPARPVAYRCGYQDKEHDRRRAAAGDHKCDQSRTGIWKRGVAKHTHPVEPALVARFRHALSAGVVALTVARQFYGHGRC